MTHAEFVEYVGVLQGDVDDRDLGEQQALEHGQVDHAAGALLVGAHALEVEAPDRRPDAAFVHGVEIDVDGRLRIALASERHRDEHQRLGGTRDH